MVCIWGKNPIIKPIINKTYVIIQYTYVGLYLDIYIQGVFCRMFVCPLKLNNIIQQIFIGTLLLDLDMVII